MTPKIKVKNVRIVEFPTITDPRGSLSVCEKENMPFIIKRTFWIYNTPGKSIRGGHAHKKSWQLHLCFNKSVTINLDDGKNKQTITLNDPKIGLIVGPMVWHPFILEKGALMQVLSSNLYDKKDYIHSYEDFLKFFKKK